MLDDVQRRRIALPERGVEIALLDWGGSGPPVLFHHANGFCVATLDLVARPLREHFRVIGMDARGHGDSSRPDGAHPFAWNEFGSDAAAIARRLCDEFGAALALGLGHSFGGTSLLLAAAEAPECFERVVGVDPVLHQPPEQRSLDPARRERVAGLIERTAQRRSVFPDRAAARESWSGKSLFENWLPQAFDLYLDEALGDRPDGQVELKCSPEVEAAVFSEGFGSDLWGPSAGLPVPALLLWASRGDFPRSMFEAFAATLAHARVEDVEAGHLAPMERPERVVAAVLEFCGRSGGAQRSTG